MTKLNGTEHKHFKWKKFHRTVIVCKDFGLNI